MTNDPNIEDADRVQEIRETHSPGEVNREEVVYDTGRERQATLVRITQLVWLLGGLLIGLLGIRFILKLIAANPANPFAALVYQFTDVFLWPFAGLTVTPGVGNVVLEIPTLIGILIYALITWAVVKIIWVLFAPNRSRRVTTYRQNRL